MILGLRVLAAGTLLAGTSAFASGSFLTPYSAGNPASASMTQSNLAQQRLIDMLIKTAPHAAAGANEWFQNPSVFAEYAYNQTDDARQNGFDTDVNSGTVGLNFFTKGDVAAGLMFNYGSTNGDAYMGVPGNYTSNDADNFGFTLSAAKSFNWFFMGVSAGYDNSDADMVTPVGNRVNTEADSYTVAPFIGAMYVKGNFSFSTAPTLVMRWQDFDTNGANSESSDVTFGLMNTASYQFTEAFSVSVMANWNSVVEEDLAVGAIKADHNWYSVGTKLSYRFTDKFTTYASYMIDLDSSTYENQRVTAGLSLAF